MYSRYDVIWYAMKKDMNEVICLADCTLYYSWYMLTRCGLHCKMPYMICHDIQRHVAVSSAESRLYLRIPANCHNLPKQHAVYSPFIRGSD